ncbi:MAG TPA: allantoinase AllB [Thermoanaerobaculia bacterium]|nr:allantoinase AllB [Thermoanaerobaculia bacterium]
MNFVIRSQRVVTPAGVVPAAIHVNGGRIERVTGYGEAGHGEVVDRGDSLVMPGIVDSHVHVNEPGRSEWEGFESATRAAAAGGVTTIIDMPLNSIPATVSVEAMRAKQEAMAGKLMVDVGLWGGVVPGNEEELRPMLEAGVFGFKCFLVDSGVDEFPPVTASDLALAFETLRGTGAPLLVHAELPGPIDRAPHCEGDDYRRFLESRPAAAEIEAIELVAALCRKHEGRAHIVHLSAAGALPIVARARSEGVVLSAETTPHYLHLEAERIPDGATEFKCAPPIREHENRERLWEGLSDGTIELVVSDHSPCSPDLKKRDQGDFGAAWGGISSLQLVLPIVWTEASRRGFGPVDVARWLCEGPARLCGLEGRKGSIREGADADLVVWDPAASFVVDPATIHHRHKLTPYAGETLRGVVEETWVRGLRQFHRGVFAEPAGEWLRRL